MTTFRIFWSEGRRRWVGYVRAESESAARQCWISDELDEYRLLSVKASEIRSGIDRVEVLA